jgi:outer membrane murein-binding lipoprotein Lpp
MTYSNSLALGRRAGAFAGRNQNGVAFRSSQERALGPISNSIILIVLALVLGMLYLAQVTKTNAYGYKIASLQTEQAQLNTQKDDLQVDAARLQSVARIQDSDQAKALVSVAPSKTVKE